MKLSSVCGLTAALVSYVHATILQNGQVRETNYPDTKIDPGAYQFKDYPPVARELSFKGRWDSKYISWWSSVNVCLLWLNRSLCGRTPGLTFGFTGNQIAITFGPYTIDTTLIAYRISGQDWQFTNVTSNATHLLVSAKTPAVDITMPISPKRFELRVTNWAYGVQIAKVCVWPI